ncbi:hypothetical protein PG988_010460 [Apiospora saccharicola]
METTTAPPAGAEETPEVAGLPPAPSAKMEATTAPLPGAEETTGTPNSSTKPKALLSPKRIGTNDTGLKIMSQPENDEVDYDIVAVHGIGVDPVSAWQHRTTKANWLKEETMLPKQLPRARIMTYGYQSYWFGDDAVNISIEGVASSLLQDLDDAREDCPERPLLLVGHCFGGLVMQKVRMFEQAFWLRYELTLVRGLHNGGAVGNLQAKNQAPQIFCFYETKRTNTGAVVGRKDIPLEYVASKSSAVLSGHKDRGLPLDHFNLNKFENCEDQGYVVVMREIVKMAKASYDILRRRGLGTEFWGSWGRDFKTRVWLYCEAILVMGKRVFTRSSFQSVMFVCIEKLRGSGVRSKTHIAVEYAHRFHADHPGSHVHWVNANCPLQFENSYTRIAETLHLSKAELKASGVLAAVRDALQQDVNGQWLMVLDGLEDTDLKGTSGASAGTRLLSYLPKSSSRSQTLVTTRSNTIASALFQGRAESIITVRQLADEDASFLLLGGITTDKHRQSVSINTAQKLGGSAGTLTLAHLYKKKTRIHWNDYLHKMGLETTPLKGEQLPQRAWQLVFELLQKTNGDAAELLLLIASLDVQTVSNVFFKRNELSGLTLVLVGHGMIEPSADSRLINLTPLVRRCVRVWLSETEKKGPQEAKTLSEVVHRFEEGDPDTSSHILPCALAAIKFQPTTEGKTDLATLLWKVAHYYIRHEQHRLAQGYLERCLKLREDDPPCNDELIQKTKCALKKTKDQTQAPLAVNANPAFVAETQLRELEKMQGDDHVGTIRKASDLAKLNLMHGGKGTSGQVVAQYQRVLDWCIKNRGPDHLDTARQQHNLARACEASGDHERAAKLYLQATRATERFLGPDNAEQLRILAHMACMYAEQGQRNEAQDAFERALRGQQRLLGFDHPETMVTRQNMALFLGDGGQVEAAGKLLQEVLVVQVDLLGQEDPNTLSTACSLALNLRLRGRYEDSAKMFISTWKMQGRVLGKTHRDTVKTKAMLDELTRETSSPSQ